LEKDRSEGIRNIGGFGGLGVGSEVKDGTGLNTNTARHIFIMRQQSFEEGGSFFREMACMKAEFEGRRPTRHGSRHYERFGLFFFKSEKKKRKFTFKCPNNCYHQ